MLTRTFYFILFLVFLGSYGLTINSLFSTSWIHFMQPANTPPGPRPSPFPGRTSVYYGLFHQCTIGGRCNSFPNSTNGDCQEPGFCILWNLARIAMILAAVIGSYLVIHLLGLVFGSSEKRQRGWKIVVFVLFVIALFQILGMAIIAHLFSTSTLFYVGTNYGSCFVLNIISWIVEVFSAGFLFVYSWKHSGVAQYEPIPENPADEHAPPAVEHTYTNPPAAVHSEASERSLQEETN
ncbi:hypothetical protein K493DRAFT_293221 [Basidiobolus meristosporus CBS 931.73]|uniref:Uncharacterized protein n=1 Tax=Basidiobolus meristosporus CBS 931.73 TaxID=1314790 RepID=A0A1Y1X2M1_9FUNG|nr:hypothetical protein K493DRAFT_293221 [Basidiobolus meristosporus CBS 931.73]|eukprot:ORX80050.1 hypothetical protein K493DRAFT_293221 [Basidiobolus meristosporus CBS 931.73]